MFPPHRPFRLSKRLLPRVKAEVESFELEEREFEFEHVSLESDAAAPGLASQVNRWVDVSRDSSSNELFEEDLLDDDLLDDDELSDDDEFEKAWLFDLLSSRHHLSSSALSSTPDISSSRESGSFYISGSFLRDAISFGQRLWDVQDGEESDSDDEIGADDRRVVWASERKPLPLALPPSEVQTLPQTAQTDPPPVLTTPHASQTPHQQQPIETFVRQDINHLTQ